MQSSAAQILFYKDNGQMPCLVPSSPEEWALLKDGGIKSDEDIKTF